MRRMPAGLSCSRAATASAGWLLHPTGAPATTLRGVPAYRGFNAEPYVRSGAVQKILGL